MMLTEQRIYWLLILAAFVYLFHLMSPILGPFLFSALLAYLGDPLVDRLEERMTRTWSVVTVFVTIITLLVLVVVFFVPLVSEQLKALLVQIPQVVNYLQSHVFPFFQEKLNLGESASSQAAITSMVRDNLKALPELVDKLINWLTGSSSFIFTVLANVFLVPVLTFYLLRDWDKLVAKVHALLPRQQAPKITQIAKESDEMLASFLRGQFVVMNLLSLIYMVGLSVIGLKSALIIGFIAGWLSFVPYLGLISGIFVAAVMAYFQFGDVLHPFFVIIVFAIAQALEAAVLTPRFVGEQIGLHPVVVIFAVLAGGQLGGFAGVLLALPVAAVLNVMITHAQSAYRQSKLYQGE